MRDAKFYHFSGLAAFGRECKERRLYNPSASDDWAGGTAEQAYNFCERGDVSRVPDAERIVERLDDSIDSEGLVQRWEPSVVGAFPLVPAYLAGTPESMLTKNDVPDARGDVEIWANTTVSAKCSAHDMMRRGVVTLAFAMALSRVRNVRIVLYSTCNSSNVAIRLGSPIDYSEVCAAFCQPSITRRLIYGHARPDGFHGKWASWSEVLKGRSVERDALERFAGMPTDAVHLSTETLGGYADMDDNRLVEILNAKLREYARR